MYRPLLANRLLKQLFTIPILSLLPLMKKQFLILWLLLWGSIGLAAAQDRQVTGIVKSNNGESLPGVTVLLKGTTNGTGTGADGNFTISIPASATKPSLVFSYVGFVTQEVVVTSAATYNVTLTADTKQLDDVVVIGYQAVQRRDVTGSISSVSAQQIKDIPVNSAAEALTGRLAGVQVTSSEGTPGNQSINIRVRGGGSITQDNSPIYVVDGVQVENALNVIAPQDIASVDVLKDAAATAIYGSRGANGVVIITTKNGREGKTVVSYSGFAGFRKITKTLDVMKPADYIDYQFERARIIGNSTGGLPTFKSRFGSLNYNAGGGANDTLAISRNAPFVDWQDEVFGRNALMQTHNLSIAGGTKNTTYSLSGTTNTEDGIQLGSGFDRKLLNFRFENKVSDLLRVGFNARVNDQVVKGTGTSSSGSTTTSRLRNTILTPPLTVSIPGVGGLDPNVFDADLISNGTLVSPIIAINNEYRRDKRRLYNFSAFASLNITKNLTFRSTVGYDNTNTTLEQFYGQYSPVVRGSNFANQPYVQLTTGLLTTLNNSNVLSYTYTKDKHHLDALLGHEIYETRNTSQNIQVNYLPLDITAERALANVNQGVPPAGSVQPSPTTSIAADSRLLSGFGRVNYSFDDKYLLTASFRADASTKFKTGNKLGYFPAASVAWRISKEEFMKSATAISDLKLRVSYGASGNNRISDFQYDPTFTTGAFQYATGANLTPATVATALANPNLKWETTLSNNVGIDLGLFNNRVQVTFDAYYNRTKDLLLNAPISPTSGYLTQFANIGSTSNKGLELQISGTAVHSTNFNWTVTGNASINRNRVDDLGPGVTSQLFSSGWASTAIAADYILQVGQPVGQMYGYVTDGFYTTADFKSYNATTKTWVLNDGIADDQAVTGGSQLPAPGVIKLKDQNGDGKVNDADRTVIGNANPKLIGGLNQQFTYKNFDLSVFMNFVLGNDVYNANKIEFTSAVNPLSNLLTTMNDRYRTIDANGATVTDVAALDALNKNATIWTPTRQLFLHSWAVEDGSFLRINNLTLGYTLPKTLTAKAKMSQVRFYATVNNLYTFTKYTGYDPESNTRRATPLTPGVDYAGYPRSKAFLFGVNLSI